MSQAINELQVPILPPVDYKAIREQLRKAREQHVPTLSLDDVAASTGLNRATIHSIENVKREPDLKPKIDTIEVLAPVYGLTLSLVLIQKDETVQVTKTALLKSAGRSGQDRVPSAETQESHASASLAATSTTRDLEAFGRGIGRSIVEELRAADRERENPNRKSAKPKRRPRS